MVFSPVFNNPASKFPETDGVSIVTAGEGIPAGDGWRSGGQCVSVRDVVVLGRCFMTGGGAGE